MSFISRILRFILLCNLGLSFGQNPRQRQWLGSRKTHTDPRIQQRPRSDVYYIYNTSLHSFANWPGKHDSRGRHSVPWNGFDSNHSLNRSEEKMVVKVNGLDRIWLTTRPHVQNQQSRNHVDHHNKLSRENKRTFRNDRFLNNQLKIRKNSNNLNRIAKIKAAPFSYERRFNDNHANKRILPLRGQAHLSIQNKLLTDTNHYSRSIQNAQERKQNYNYDIRKVAQQRLLPLIQFQRNTKLAYRLNVNQSQILPKNNTISNGQWSILSPRVMSVDARERDRSMHLQSNSNLTPFVRSRKIVYANRNGTGHNNDALSKLSPGYFGVKTRTIDSRRKSPDRPSYTSRYQSTTGTRIPFQKTKLNLLKPNSTTNKSIVLLRIYEAKASSTKTKPQTALPTGNESVQMFTRSYANMSTHTHRYSSYLPRLKLKLNTETRGKLIHFPRAYDKLHEHIDWVWPNMTLLENNTLDNSSSLSQTPIPYYWADLIWPDYYSNPFFRMKYYTQRGNSYSTLQTTPFQITSNLGNFFKKNTSLYYQTNHSLMTMNTQSSAPLIKSSNVPRAILINSNENDHGKKVSTKRLNFTTLQLNYYNHRDYEKYTPRPNSKTTDSTITTVNQGHRVITQRRKPIPSRDIIVYSGPSLITSPISRQVSILKISIPLTDSVTPPSKGSQITTTAVRVSKVSRKRTKKRRRKIKRKKITSKANGEQQKNILKKHVHLLKSQFEKATHNPNNLTLANYSGTNQLPTPIIQKQYENLTTSKAKRVASQAIVPHTEIKHNRDPLESPSKYFNPYSQQRRFSYVKLNRTTSSTIRIENSQEDTPQYTTPRISNKRTIHSENQIKPHVHSITYELFNNRRPSFTIIKPFEGMPQNISQTTKKRITFEEPRIITQPITRPKRMKITTPLPQLKTKRIVTMPFEGISQNMAPTTRMTTISEGPTTRIKSSARSMRMKITTHIPNVKTKVMKIIPFKETTKNTMKIRITAEEPPKKEAVNSKMATENFKIKRVTEERAKLFHYLGKLAINKTMETKIQNRITKKPETTFVKLSTKKAIKTISSEKPQVKAGTRLEIWPDYYSNPFFRMKYYTQRGNSYSTLQTTPFQITSNLGNFFKKNTSLYYQTNHSLMTMNTQSSAPLIKSSNVPRAILINNNENDHGKKVSTKRSNFTTLQLNYYNHRDYEKYTPRPNSKTTDSTITTVNQGHRVITQRRKPIPSRDIIVYSGPSLITSPISRQVSILKISIPLTDSVTPPSKGSQITTTAVRVSKVSRKRTKKRRRKIKRKKITSKANGEQQKNILKKHVHLLKSQFEKATHNPNNLTLANYSGTNQLPTPIIQKQYENLTTSKAKRVASQAIVPHTEIKHNRDPLESPSKYFNPYSQQRRFSYVKLNRTTSSTIRIENSQEDTPQYTTPRISNKRTIHSENQIKPHVHSITYELFNNRRPSFTIIKPFEGMPQNISQTTKKRITFEEPRIITQPITRPKRMKITTPLPQLKTKRIVTMPFEGISQNMAPTTRMTTISEGPTTRIKSSARSMRMKITTHIPNVKTKVMKIIPFKETTKNTMKIRITAEEPPKKEAVNSKMATENFKIKRVTEERAKLFHYLGKLAINKTMETKIQNRITKKPETTFVKLSTKKAIKTISSEKPQVKAGTRLEIWPDYYSNPFFRMKYYTQRGNSYSTLQTTPFQITSNLGNFFKKNTSLYYQTNHSLMTMNTQSSAPLIKSSNVPRAILINNNENDHGKKVSTKRSNFTTLQLNYYNHRDYEKYTPRPNSKTTDSTITTVNQGHRVITQRRKPIPSRDIIVYSGPSLITSPISRQVSILKISIPLTDSVTPPSKGSQITTTAVRVSKVGRKRTKKRRRKIKRKKITSKANGEQQKNILKKHVHLLKSQFEKATHNPNNLTLANYSGTNQLPTPIIQKQYENLTTSKAKRVASQAIVPHTEIKHNRDPLESPSKYFNPYSQQRRFSYVKLNRTTSSTIRIENSQEDTPQYTTPRISNKRTIHSENQTKPHVHSITYELFNNRRPSFTIIKPFEGMPQNISQTTKKRITFEEPRIITQPITRPKRMKITTPLPQLKTKRIVTMPFEGISQNMAPTTRMTTISEGPTTRIKSSARSMRMKITTHIPNVKTKVMKIIPFKETTKNTMKIRITAEEPPKKEAVNSKMATENFKIKRVTEERAKLFHYLGKLAINKTMETKIQNRITKKPETTFVKLSTKKAIKTISSEKPQVEAGIRLEKSPPRTAMTIKLRKSPAIENVNKISLEELNNGDKTSKGATAFSLNMYQSTTVSSVENTFKDPRIKINDSFYKVNGPWNTTTYLDNVTQSTLSMQNLRGLTRKNQTRKSASPTTFFKASKISTLKLRTDSFKNLTISPTYFSNLHKKSAIDNTTEIRSGTAENETESTALSSIALNNMIFTVRTNSSRRALPKVKNASVKNVYSLYRTMHDLPDSLNYIETNTKTTKSVSKVKNVSTGKDNEKTERMETRAQIQVPTLNTHILATNTPTTSKAEYLSRRPFNKNPFINHMIHNPFFRKDDSNKTHSPLATTGVYGEVINKSKPFQNPFWSHNVKLNPFLMKPQTVNPKFTFRHESTVKEWTSEEPVFSKPTMNDKLATVSKKSTHYVTTTLQQATEKQKMETAITKTRSSVGKEKHLGLFTSENAIASRVNNSTQVSPNNSILSSTFESVTMPSSMFTGPFKTPIKLNAEASLIIWTAVQKAMLAASQNLTVHSSMSIPPMPDRLLEYLLQHVRSSVSPMISYTSLQTTSVPIEEQKKTTFSNYIYEYYKENTEYGEQVLPTNDRYVKINPDLPQNPYYYYY